VGTSAESLPALHDVLPSAEVMATQTEKRGAGLLLRSGEEVLLLLRRSAHNDLHWGLPGGNCEDGDTDLEETARREATEELGPLPPLKLTSSHVTHRGKHLEKEYTVFSCILERTVRDAWKPKLNEEHREWRWFPVAAVNAAGAGVAGAPAPLHPVVAALVTQGVMREELVAS
jgi:8-oxo-dGTP pyrophosphatase MutT (NUDIX family)